ncbi:hypothetical protein [Raineya sp.]|jgi:hypothetical protein
MKFQKIYRHGDVVIFRLPEKELGKKQLNPKPVQKLVLALGEVTGHKHLLEGDLMLLENNAANGEFLFEVKNTAILQHEEHDTIVLEKGFYLKVNQVEYDPFNDLVRFVYD